MEVSLNAPRSNFILGTALIKTFFHKNKILITALTVLGGLVAYLYFSPRPLKQIWAKKIGSNPRETKEVTPALRIAIPPKTPSQKTPYSHPNSEIKKSPRHEPIDKFRPLITQGKQNALDAYKENLGNCKKTYKAEIFIDINSIEPQQDLEEKIISIVDLLHYMSGSLTIDLKNPLSTCVVLDALQRIKMTLCEELCKWLGTQESLEVDLLNKSLGVFSEMDKNQSPFRLESIHSLIEIYKVKSAPSADFSPEFLSAVKILVDRGPNENKVLDIVHWMMKQKERFKDEIFLDLAQILKKKEKEKSAVNLYYPLLKQMITDFKLLKDSKGTLEDLFPKKSTGSKNEKSLEDLIDFLVKKESEFSIELN